MWPFNEFKHINDVSKTGVSLFSLSLKSLEGKYHFFSDSIYSQLQSWSTDHSTILLKLTANYGQYQCSLAKGQWADEKR